VGGNRSARRKPTTFGRAFSHQSSLCHNDCAVTKNSTVSEKMWNQQLTYHITQLNFSVSATYWMKTSTLFKRNESWWELNSRLCLTTNSRLTSHQLWAVSNFDESFRYTRAVISSHLTTVELVMQPLFSFGRDGWLRKLTVSHANSRFSTLILTFNHLGGEVTEIIQF
jgi:hypothetical protein